MSGTLTDFIVELQGDRAIGRNDEDPLKIDLTGYRARRDPGITRTLVHMTLGAADSGKGQQLDFTFIQAVVTAIRGRAPLGMVCICGYSKGATYTLKLAQDLKQAGVEITYAGLSDLPLFPFGNIPPISGFPPMVPRIDPQMDPTRFGLPVRVLFGPFVKGPEVFAKEKQNYAQNAGNGMSPTRRHPTDFIPFGWWWSSNMPFNEIHGSVDGWVNLPLSVPDQGTDADMHSAGDAAGRLRIASDIGAILAK